MPAQLEALVQQRLITSTDHRVIQAVAMFAESKKLPYEVLYPKAVAKSWPKFWDFIKLAQS